MAKKVLTDAEKTDKMRKYMVKTPKDFNWFRTFWQWLVVKFWYGMSFHGIYRLEVEGKENIPKTNNYVVVGNHLSTLDPLLMAYVLPNPIAFMAKKELFYNPLLKIQLDWLGTFAVDREKVGLSTIKTAKSIKETKRWVLGLFPQGTREKSGEINNVTHGFVGLAKATKCNILPIGIVGSDNKKVLPFTGKIKVKIGKVIELDENNTEKMYNEWIEAIQKLTDFKYNPEPTVKKDMSAENEKEISKQTTPEIRTFNRRYTKEYHFLRWCFQIFTIFLGLPFFLWSYQINVKGKENIPKNSHVIYASNHVSMFDPLWVSTAVFKPIAYMAKKELFEDDCNLQWWVKRLGAFSVNRQKPELSTFKTIKDVFKTNWALGIFPQGSIKDNKKIENIRKGFAIIAKNAHADIIPVAISGFEGYTKKFHAQKVTITIGKPISHKLPPEEITVQWSKFICDNTGFENCMLTYTEDEHSAEEHSPEEKATL